MDNLCVADPQNMFKLNISQSLIIEICNLCKISLPNETGGILIGTYKENFTCASVSEILKAPPDSKAGPTWFFRGTKGVKKKLDNLWVEKKHYYLGEWHFHPNGSSDLSNQDIKQMTLIANDNAYKCPEPILLIIGGNLLSWEYSSYVFPKGKEFVRFQ
ncbi:Mov34/MPN/PAD-1 family protein [Bacillus canaveralius]|uniref:Mov34/MPN/PAD-1 family protein n=1 Tax=Bacillus canaveralius TaxID=1403243 RepID=UPI00163A4A5C|nr:Mov34/MPN/PAD-1 family protein [Bacillus canaveralius]